MAFRVKVAETVEELDALFQCRHRIYVEQDGMPADPTGRNADVYDAWPFPECVNFVAFVGDEVVGGIRLLRRRPGRGTSADDMFDFEAHLDPGTSHVSASKLCVDQRIKSRAARLTRSLFLMLYHYCLVNRLEILYGCFRASLFPIGESLGARAVGPVTTQGTISWVPFVARPDGLFQYPRWNRMLRDHDVREFTGIWERRFFEPGEVVYARGEQAEEAYVVVAGEVELRPSRRDPLVIARPWMFGDDEMLEGRVRAFDVVAVTEVDLIVVDRAAYFRQVAAQPAGAVKFARMLLEGEAPAVLSRRTDLADTLDFPDTAPDVANVPEATAPLDQRRVAD